MKTRLFYNTVTPGLRLILSDLMRQNVFDDFRLVGGTALSLQLGHRQSVDIDLFTDKTYGTADFKVIENYLRSQYPYFEDHAGDLIGMGKSYYLGQNNYDCVKLDVYYTDPFMRPEKRIDGIRMADREDILAMKLEVVSRTGRKKDFWDLHELMETYSLEQMLALHAERNPILHDKELILEKLCHFEAADGDFEPLCLRNKHWELIKLDFLDAVKAYRS